MSSGHDTLPRREQETHIIRCAAGLLGWFLFDLLLVVVGCFTLLHGIQREQRSPHRVTVYIGTKVLWSQMVTNPVYVETVPYAGFDSSGHSIVLWKSETNHYWSTWAIK